MAKLAKYVHLEDKDGNPVVFGPDDDVPGWAAKQITSPSAWAAESSEPDEDDDDLDDDPADEEDDDDPASVVDYSALKKDALEAEVAKRNEARDESDQIVVGGNGNVPDLIAALQADDQAGD